MIATIVLPAAGTLLVGAPLEALYLFYCWDVRTWAARCHEAEYDRAMRDSGKLARDRATAVQARRELRWRGQLADLPPARAVARDDLTQPVFARVDLRRDLPEPARQPLLARLHRGRTA